MRGCVCEGACVFVCIRACMRARVCVCVRAQARVSGPACARASVPHPCLHSPRRSSNTLSGTQLAVETVFLEASCRAVTPGSSGLSERQADALERLAFDWVLNAEKYVDPRFVELAQAREKVGLALCRCSIRGVGLLYWV
jgi:hypothetical protein